MAIFNDLGSTDTATRQTRTITHRPGRFGRLGEGLTRFRLNLGLMSVNLEWA